MDTTPKYNKDTPEPMEEDAKGENNDKTPDYKSKSNTNNESNSNTTPNIPASPPRNDPSNSLLSMMGCRSVDNYQKISRVQEGTYGVVCTTILLFSTTNH